MLKLRDIMTREVDTLEPEMSIRDAMARLSSRHVSGAPVVSGHMVVGVVSMTDLVELATSLPGVRGASDEWREWTADAEPVEEDESIPSASYFTELWTDDGADVAARLASSSALERDALDEHTVSEAMTRTICALPSMADVREAADYMRTTGIHRVLVVDEGRLSGIVSTMDIARAVAEDRLVRRTYVFDRPARARR